MTKTVSFLALSCVGFIATAPAFAEDGPKTPAVDADPQTRDDIVVEGERQRRDSNPKFVASIVDTPRSIIVLPSETIQQTGSATLVDALRTIPGITFGAAEGGNPIGDRPFIRGFDSQGSTYVDGVRDFAAQSREVFAIDQIQVIRGSDTTLGGRGNAGGTINIISKVPQPEDFVAVAGSYGTDDYKRITADVNHRLTDTIAVRVEGVWHDQDIAGRDAIWQKRWGVAPSVTIGLGTPTRLTVGYYHLESQELPDSGIPYLYTIGNAPLGTSLSQPAIGNVTTIAGTTGYVDRSTFYGVKSRDFRDTSVDQATVRVEHDFGGITLRNTSRFTHNDQSYIYTQPDDQQGNVFGTNVANPATAGGLVWRRANTRYGYADSIVNQTDLFGEFATGAIKHSFAAGAELAWEKARRGTFVTRGFTNAAGNELLSTGSTISPRCTPPAIARYYCTSLFTPDANDPWVNYANDTSTTPAAISRNLTVAETQNDANTVGVYGFDSITLAEPLILNIGARYDRFHSRVRPGQPIAATSQIQYERTDELFNWQAGLVFKPTHDTSVYASYATAATPPNSLLGEGQEGNALPTTGGAANAALADSLKPEKTKSYEVGAKAALMGGRLNLGVAVFQTDTQNARVTGPDNVPQFIGKRRIRGVELTATGTILPGWTIFGGYTHLDPVITDGGFTALTAAAVGTQPAKTVQVVSVNTGRQAPQTARDSVSIWTNATLFDRLQIGGGAFYVSRVYGGYSDNRAATQNAAGVVTVTPATKLIERSIPGYWRFDARAGFDITKRVNLSVNVQNLTDKTYFSQAYTAHYATIAPGRSAFATLAVRY
ncbi:TonB-dependent receptor [Sphingomonas sp. EC-HK361]|uniref:TonB-dependent receptor n=1 Tax=Sphingomonas sp. EC-HK361 TaxID=2038397 RepID=UPI001258DA4E|nr:TonB-dependent receptor [Sphingomonas sp. EC-HK361]VVT13197.1 TonB-dependent receptor [Sphingomonas sp. EC-HK361]